MAFLVRAKKEDLYMLAGEFKEEVPPDSTKVDLKRIITGSAEYEEVLAKEMLASIIEEREGNEEKERNEIEREKEKNEIEREKERNEIEREKEREHQFRMRELELQGGVGRNGVSVSGSEESLEGAGRNFLGYLNIMKGVALEPPHRAEEWPFFFRHAEMMFKLYEVPEKYWGKITLHHLKGKVRGVIASVGETHLDEYDKIKEVVLKEFQITPLQHKKNFDECRKKYVESYAQYVGRVETALDLYLQSREVSTFERLKQLFVADKVKDGLPSNIKAHIYLKETGGWLPGTDLANELDNYIHAIPKGDIQRQNNTAWETNTPSERKQGFPEQKWGRKCETTNRGSARFSKDRVVTHKNEESGKKPVKCFNCQGEGHVKRLCPKINNVCSNPEINKGEEKRGLNKVCAELKYPLDSLEDLPLGEDERDLPRVDFSIDNITFSGIIDSGAEITVIRKSVVPECYLEEGGVVVLRPAIGPEVEAQLALVPLSLGVGKEEIQPYVKVHVAVVQNLNEVALVTPQVFRLLKEQKEKYLGCDMGKDTRGVLALGVEKEKGDGDPSSNISDEEGNEGPVIPIALKPGTQSNENETIKEPERDPPISQVQAIKREQRECESLKKAWVDAERKKNGYWMEAGLLYHTGSVCGQRYNQLVVPVTRRNDIIRLAHETVSGGHLGAKKTRDRIVMSFWWDGLMSEVRRWCESCHACQLRRKKKLIDRAPIEAVGRPELPFQVMNADIFGPVEPKSARGHKYVLCVMDQHSRWPEAVPLRSLTAKATCDAFIEIFMRTGIPRVIAMDNATNFASKLTKEFLSRLGVVPKFSTPGYPQSNGLVERFIGTMKSMLHHAILTQGSAWDKQLPYLLWAYREVPNATTGVPPFVLVYGRLPVGPLSILKSSWEDDTVLPQGIGESVSEYLRSLRDRLQGAETFAAEQTKVQQNKYVHHHNLRSSDKQFGLGDEVVVLIPDTTNKLCARWIGPGEIVRVKSPHSFLVKFPDGNTRHLHQNKLRKYIQPVNAMGIIYESDEEFGEVQHAPVEERISCGQWLNKIKKSGKWDHLKDSQRQKLTSLIKNYHPVFDGEIKRAKVGSHVIQLKPEVDRKQPHIYRVPESIRPQVEKQIAELLERGLIEPSTAEIVYPIVCVTKKDGTVRLCCDYRRLTRNRELFPFPMQNSEELRFKAGAANFLSTIDILKGYWEIPLDKNSRELTSFVSRRASINGR